MLTLFHCQTLGQRNPHFGMFQHLGIGNRIHAAELENPYASVLPHPFHLEPASTHGLCLAEQENFAELLKSFRPAAERDRGQPSAISPRPPQAGNGHPLVFFLKTHSRISSVNRRFNFIPAAPRMVRIERAVRPCLPITLPRSLGATRSSRTVTCSPSTTFTATSSGMSTRAFAISSINCFIPPPPKPILIDGAKSNCRRGSWICARVWNRTIFGQKNRVRMK